MRASRSRPTPALTLAALLVAGCSPSPAAPALDDAIAQDRTPPPTTTSTLVAPPETPFGGRGTAEIVFGGQSAVLEGVVCSRNGDVVQAVAEPPDNEVLRDIRVVVSEQASVVVTDVEGAHWRSDAPIAIVDGDVVRVDGSLTRGAESIGLSAVISCAPDAGGS